MNKEKVNLEDEVQLKFKRSSVSSNIENEYWAKKLNKERQDFNIAETQMWLTQNQNLQDLLFVCSNLDEWMSVFKEKDPDNYKLNPKWIVLNDTVSAYTRIDSYCRNLETSNNAAIVNFLSKERDLEQLKNQMYREKLQVQLLEKKYQQKIKELEEEVKFISKSS